MTEVFKRVFVFEVILSGAKDPSELSLFRAVPRFSTSKRPLWPRFYWKNESNSKALAMRFAGRKASHSKEGERV
jgi:hypothetical protein